MALSAKTTYDDAQQTYVVTLSDMQGNTKILGSYTDEATATQAKSSSSWEALVFCPDCNGSGFKNDDFCELCTGQGYTRQM